uniref:Uncharacterized protein n=1 Tax=Parascaris equorum TaxID=6256 RepID=A0A914RFK6_PAREQ
LNSVAAGDQLWSYSSNEIWSLFVKEEGDRWEVSKVTTEISAEFSSADRAALFAEINKGEDITKGLRKVTADMQTHKNPALRAQVYIFFICFYSDLWLPPPVKFTTTEFLSRNKYLGHRKFSIHDCTLRAAGWSYGLNAC